MRIGVFTLRSIEPLHPRLAAFTEYFDENSLSYDLIPGYRHAVFSRLNWTSFFFFDLWSVFKNREKTKDYDLILINDLKLLPLARYAKRSNSTVIYETIDNNVALRGYSLQKKIPLTRFFMSSIMNHYSNEEKKLASKYCDTIIVNSRALADYFGPGAELLFYYSSFEKTGAPNNCKKSPALLYLGEFSEEKGATEILELRERLNTKLFIFGTVNSDKLKREISNTGIRHIARIDHRELLVQIEKLFETYFLTGVSFIKPVHLSYATQEANKDIDYLALGIPIIGNHRKPTGEKIEAGCGIFHENEIGLQKLIDDENFRYTLSENCKKYYQANYSKEIFRKVLDKIFGKYLNESDDRVA